MPQDRILAAMPARFEHHYTRAAARSHRSELAAIDGDPGWPGRKEGVPERGVQGQDDKLDPSQVREQSMRSLLSAKVLWARVELSPGYPEPAPAGARSVRAGQPTAVDRA